MTMIFRQIQQNRIITALVTVLLFIAGGYYIGKMAIEPGKIRLMFAGALLLSILAFSIRKPKLVLLFCILYLPFMGFFRRLLIPAAGWSGMDPLVLIPQVSVLLVGSYWVFQKFIRRRPIPNEKDTRLFRWIQFLLLIHMIQVFNPLQGGILAGLGGIMFYVTPLLWMILARLYFDQRWMKAIFTIISIIAVISAIYGLKQIFIGFYDFENAWVRQAGYAALNVGGEIRAFSFHSSAAEYAWYLVLAIVIAWAGLLRGNSAIRIVSILLLPLLVYALFLESSRTPVILGTFGLALMTITNARKGAVRWIVIFVTMICLVGMYFAVSNIDVGDSALLAHQVNGLNNPFDEEHSTFWLHYNILMNGIWKGLKMPIGHGLGSTTLAAAKFSDSGDNAEVDFANILISDGIIGGVLYLLIVFYALFKAFRYASTVKGIIPLAILGILLSTLFTWSIGGNYSTAAIIWLCIGYLDREVGSHDQRHHPDLSPSSRFRALPRGRRTSDPARR
jgi:hypothetical protein